MSPLWPALRKTFVLHRSNQRCPYRLPVTETAMTSQLSPLPEISDSANVDDPLVVQPSSQCDTLQTLKNVIPPGQTAGPQTTSKITSESNGNNRLETFCLVYFFIYVFPRSIFLRRCYIVTSFPDNFVTWWWSCVTDVSRVHWCACAEWERVKKELELSCLIWLVIFNNFVLGIPSYNRKHFLLSYLKTLSVGPAGIWT